MKIKTFYARTMAEALVDIKANLGPDALILSTKPIARRSGLGGSASGIQVVAATDSSTVPDLDGTQDSVGIAHKEDRPDLTAVHSESRPAERAADETPALHAGTEADRQEVGVYSPATLRRRARGIAQPCDVDSHSEETHRSASNGSAPAAGTPVPLGNAFARKVYEDLLANDISQELALSLVEQGCRSLSVEGRRPSRSGITRAVADAAAKMLPDSQSHNGLPLKQLVVFVGPAGVGKTTVVAKLAANLSLLNQKKVALFTLDTYRIGAVDQLRTYASFMGLPFRVASDLDDLRKAIGEHSRRDYILVDTPGRFPQQTEPVSEMMDFLRATDRSECHLVLSATTKYSDMRRMVQWYEGCKPDYLVFTKLDETTTLGPLLNELVRTQKSLSYYTDGQKVPDDLHSVPREQIIQIVLNANSNGASTWIERPSPALSDALPRTETKSRQTRKAPAKSNPSPQPRKRKARAQESLL